MDKLSKQLSWLLRHGLLEKGIPYGPDGYVSLSEIMKIFPHFTRASVEEIVTQDGKQRFSLIEREGESFVRANQGHSRGVGANLDSRQIYTEITEAGPCFHGTKHEHVGPILATGLNKMRRTHIHFVPEINQDGVTSGFRGNSDVVVWINMETAMVAGIEFFRSANGVILSSGIDGVIPPEFITKVTDRATGEEV
jgi:2'-phosphotransferase